MSYEISSVGINGMAGTSSGPFRHLKQQTHRKGEPGGVAPPPRRLGNAVSVTHRRAPPARHQVTKQFASPGLVVLLVHVDQQFYGLVAHRLFEGIRDKDAFQGLQQRPVDVVPPEGVQVGELGELDVADDGAQVSGLQDGVGLVEALELPLHGLLLVGEDVALKRRLVLAILGTNPEADVTSLLLSAVG